MFRNNQNKIYFNHEGSKTLLYFLFLNVKRWRLHLGTEWDVGPQLLRCLL